jgi:hypothetical protein
MQNFGKIKNAFNELLTEGIVRKDDKTKKLFKDYVKTIKENEILKTQFLIYSNIENKIEKDDLKANLFIQENLALLNKFSKKEIQEANTKLSQPVLVEGDADYENKELHENISKLIFLAKNAKNVETIVEATSNIINFMKTNKEKEVGERIDLPNSMITSIMVDKYNEKYASLDESEKETIKAIINSDDDKKVEMYSNMLRECIDLIDTKLTTSDLDTKDKLLKVKDKLLNDKKEINEDFNKNISKLIELRITLKS